MGERLHMPARPKVCSRTPQLQPRGVWKTSLRLSPALLAQPVQVALLLMRRPGLEVLQRAHVIKVSTFLPSLPPARHALQDDTRMRIIPRQHSAKLVIREDTQTQVRVKFQAVFAKPVLGADTRTQVKPKSATAYAKPAMLANTQIPEKRRSATAHARPVLGADTRSRVKPRRIAVCACRVAKEST